MRLVNSVQACDLKRRIAVVFFLVVLFGGDGSFAQEGKASRAPMREEVLANGYRYGLEVKASTSTDADYRSEITIRTIDKKVLLYQEIGGLPAGSCKSLPGVSLLPLEGSGTKRPRSLVVFCGSDLGRRETLKVFGAPGFRSASLNFEDSYANLTHTGAEGKYESKVYRRLLLPDVGYSVLPYLTIYTLVLDQTLVGFVPTFSDDLSGQYLHYFEKIKKTKLGKIPLDHCVGPMLAALLASGDKSKICSEVRTFSGYGLTVKELQQWGERLRKAGYPAFDLMTCDGGSK